MNRHRGPSIICFASIAFAAGLLACGITGCRRALPRESVDAQRLPAIKPDFGGGWIPPNIAPLNFMIQEKGNRFAVRIHGKEAEGFLLTSRTGKMILPMEKWKSLLAASRGKEISLDVYTRDPNGRWLRYRPVTATIAPDDIDPYVAYRLLRPLHNLYSEMGIYQRDLTTFKESPIILCRRGEGQCVNCHSFVNGSPETISLQLRADKGSAMLIGKDGVVDKIDTRTLYRKSLAAYTSWHPGGKQAAFSVNRLTMVYHSVGDLREVFDYASDLELFAMDGTRVAAPRPLADPGALENFPAWSPDGRSLYFSRARRSWDPALDSQFKLPAEYDKVRYDLVRAPYDAERNAWGEAEVLVSSEKSGLSALEPRVSPDGRYLLFCMIDHGNFPVYEQDSDLYLMDLMTREWRRLSVNSEESDSWHSWSSNGRWIAFASKRQDGVFTRIYLSYFDRDGKAHKPVLMPQKDPLFYESCLKVYNVPELITGPVRIPPRIFHRAIQSPAKICQGDATTEVPPKTDSKVSSTTPGPALDNYAHPE